MKSLHIPFTSDELETVIRALSIAAVLYTEPDKLPDMKTWSPSERAMAAAEMEMLSERLLPIRLTLRVKKP
jgi:hypothetical protein